MIRYIIIAIVVSVSIFIGYKIYKKRLQEKVMNLYAIDFDQVKDKSISDLKQMVKAYQNKKP